MHPLFFPLFHHPDARGSAQGGGYRREYRNGEVDDFLPKFFLVHGSWNSLVVGCFVLGTVSIATKKSVQTLSSVP
jgi:hypothetical protein